MHKPIRIIKDDPRVRLTQQVNLTSAIRAALLTLPDKFTETELFERIAGISYGGDIRMLLPAENRNKVGNIVQTQGPQFKELYYRLVTGLPGVDWKNHCTSIVQDTSPNARLAHLRKLPSGLLKGVASPPQNPEEAAEYWTKLSSRPDLASLIHGGKFAKFCCYIETLPTPLQRNQAYREVPFNSPDCQGCRQRRAREEQSIRYGQDHKMVAWKRKGSTASAYKTFIIATPAPPPHCITSPSAFSFHKPTPTVHAVSIHTTSLIPTFTLSFI